MAVYVIEILLIMFVPLLFQARSTLSLKKSEDLKKRCCYCIFLIMLLVMGFRSETLGMYDVEYVYLPMFHNVQYLNFQEVFMRYPFIRGNMLQLITKIFTLFCTNEHIWIFITSIPFLASLTFLVIKYGANKYTCSFSFYMIIGLRIYGSNFYLIRHSIAMAALIIAFDCIIEKKRCKFIAFVLVATLFHSVSIVFLIAYPLARIKVSLKQLLIIGGGFYFATYLASNFMNSFFKVIGNDNYYANYSNKGGFKSNIFILICLLLFALAYILSRRNNLNISNNKYLKDQNKKILLRQKMKNELNIITVNMLCIATLFMGMSTVISEFQRIAFFFLAVSTVGFSNIIHCEKNRSIRVFIYVCLFIFLLIFMINSLKPEMLSPYRTWIFN